MTPEEIRAAFGANLRALRNKRGLSLQDVATKVGVTKMSVANWETGATNMELHHWPPLAAALGVKPSTLAAAIPAQAAAEPPALPSPRKRSRPS